MKSRFFFLLLLATPLLAQDKNIGAGAKPMEGAEVIIDGSRAMLDSQWNWI